MILPNSACRLKRNPCLLLGLISLFTLSGCALFKSSSQPSSEPRSENSTLSSDASEPTVKLTAIYPALRNLNPHSIKEIKISTGPSGVQPGTLRIATITHNQGKIAAYISALQHVETQKLPHSLNLDYGCNIETITLLDDLLIPIMIHIYAGNYLSPVEEMYKITSPMPLLESDSIDDHYSFTTLNNEQYTLEDYATHIEIPFYFPLADFIFRPHPLGDNGEFDVPAAFNLTTSFGNLLIYDAETFKFIPEPGMPKEPKLYQIMSNTNFAILFVDTTLA